MAKSAAFKSEALASRILARTGISLSGTNANTLRRAAVTLRTWAERECGDANGAVSRHPDGKTYWESATTGRSYPVRDLETGALNRIKEVCAATGLHFFYQTDPRGPALYVSTLPITGEDYTIGVAVY